MDGTIFWKMSLKSHNSPSSHIGAIILQTAQYVDKYINASMDKPRYFDMPNVRAGGRRLRDSVFDRCLPVAGSSKMLL